MARHLFNRRQFIGASTSAIVAGMIAPRLGFAADTESGLHISSNQFTWMKFMERDGRDFNTDLEFVCETIAATGLDGLEPFAVSADFVGELAPLLKKNGLEMRSAYISNIMHDKAKLDASVNQIVESAAKARELAGTKIIVSNPQPKGAEKTDDELKVQVEALSQLGEKLRAEDLTLAYHFHAPEMRSNGREFHYVLKNTDPAVLSLCLDTHWVYRGLGNSESAVYEITKMYAKRVVEVHLRQSENGTWCETFCPGDIDYPKVAKILLEEGMRPHLVLEQAVENGTPKTMNAKAALTKSRQYTEEAFACFMG